MGDNLEPVRQSFLQWILMALGLKYTLLLPFAAFIAFVLALIVLLRGKGPMAAAALFFIVPMPFLIGIYGAIEGLISIYQVIAAAAAQPKPSELAEGTSMALVAPMVGMLLMIPTYALATVGMTVRSLVASSERPSETRLPSNR
ncbi:MAG TPA: hypothetical protein VJ783_25355 [Pirellulales bacterium]|nr:hypothetical protein [Pirellulales bacterium]